MTDRKTDYYNGQWHKVVMQRLPPHPEMDPVYGWDCAWADEDELIGEVDAFVQRDFATFTGKRL